MLGKLINNHFDDLSTKVKPNTILVYKGFPIAFLQGIANKVQPVINTNDFIIGEKIDLDCIRSSVLSLMNKLQDTKGEVRFLIYEQFLVLMKNVNIELFKQTFLIIENNLYKEFPNQSNVSFIDIESTIESNQNIPENDLFNDFYVTSSVLDDVNYVQFQDWDISNSKNVSKDNFFHTDSIEDIEFKEVQETSPSYIAFPSTDNSFQNFKTSIYFNKVNHDMNLIVDRSVLKNEEKIDELKILNHLFKASNLQINFYLIREHLKKSFRTEFINILNTYWKSNSFRDLLFYNKPDLSNDKVTISQGAVIEAIVNQVEKANDRLPYNDVFLTAPTGSGKSVLFQIPAYYIAEKYKLVTIVVSPLKALMYDQVTALHEKGMENVVYINSDISLLEREESIERIKKGDVSIIYLSPELLLSYDITHFTGDRKIGLLVIDEAHLVTTWGRNFRVDYWYLGIYIRKLRKHKQNNFPVLALTATAVYGGQNDTVFETVASLNMQVPTLFIGNVRRDEIMFDIKRLRHLHNHEADKIQKTIEQIKSSVDNKIKTIGYFPWIGQIDQVLLMLPEYYKKRVGRYYGRVIKEERQEVIENFKRCAYLVVLATKAFGMGVDINDINMVYHHAPSGGLSDYVQEIGRVARDKSLKGIAKVDFNAKDLKFTKILYGLSSIKQYQLKLTLQKLNDIYKYKKKSNFLVSVDDFAFIFSESNDIEQKVKSSLLLLEKDMLAKFGYNVIIVRPKSLFSTVFARVNNLAEKKFVERYGSDVQKMDYKEVKNTFVIPGKWKSSDIIISEHPDDNSVFEIELNKMWQNHFEGESFPVVKKKYFDCSLFEEFEGKVIPQYKLTVTLKNDKNHTLNKLDEYFTILENTFSKFGGKFFSKRQFEKELSSEIESSVVRKRIVDLLSGLYASAMPLTENGTFKLDVDTFLQIKKLDDEIQMRIISSAYAKVKSNILKNFNSLCMNNANYLVRYIPVTGIKTKHLVKLAYVIESFMLGNYELVGGKNPQLFIRVNDPLKINVLANSHYSNDIGKDIEQRHKHAVKTMDIFFTSEMNDYERWDFVENYFLGKEVIDDQE